MEDHCQEAIRLLVTYRAALAAVDEMKGSVFRAFAQEHLTVREAVQLREDAQASLLRARRNYWRHIEAHQCASRHLIPLFVG